MTIFVGTSGWQYRHWRGVFYPVGVRQAEWLAYFAARYATVEVNSTFYRLPARSTFAAWAQQTPQDFILAVKFSRFLTHFKRLSEPAEPVRRFFDRADALGGKLGPVLLQLPPDFAVDIERLREALGEFPAGVRVAVEPRHSSWFVEDVRALLGEHGAALCWADRGSRLLTPVWRTTSWVFMRFHAGLGAPEPCYDVAALEDRARLLAECPQQDAYVFFNNDARGCALHDACMFAHACRRLGLTVTRVPTAAPIPGS
ncbi:MAG: DUF72 domain-containing protein [Egibacteraceae bacterium]